MKPSVYAWHVVTHPDAVPVMREIVRRGFLAPAKDRGHKTAKEPRYGSIRDRRKWAMERQWAEKRVGVIQNPDIRSLDRFAGDDRYVFLSMVPYGQGGTAMVGTLPKVKLSSRTYGFGFDLMGLIDGGALVGKKDLLGGYKEILRGVIYGALMERRGAYGAFAGRYQHVGEHHDIAAYVSNLSEAVMFPIIGRLGVVHRAKEQIAALQGQTRLRGRAAKTYALRVWRHCWNVMKRTYGLDPEGLYTDDFYKRCGLGSPLAEVEVLWPGRLPVNRARFVVDGGRIVDA
jgi:hypothetical protein